ncbi:hypothetical protein PR048_004973 [Dryococelus australis]|uniref:Uncharacterized protein n=1 Tax=Dryococelus australis TaxID=614101 RepID=A0ABQ9I6X2_9NEOP|nr:hypothetical protein PR048_004973 [Dryococelus australis]
MTVIGPDAANIYNTFSLTETEENSKTVIKAKSDVYFAPKTITTYERYVRAELTKHKLLTMKTETSPMVKAIRMERYSKGRPSKQTTERGQSSSLPFEYSRCGGSHQ